MGTFFSKYKRLHLGDIYVLLELSIDQFQNLEGIAGRILGYFSQSPTFFVREIFDGIAPNAGGNYICIVKYHGF